MSTFSSSEIDEAMNEASMHLKGENKVTFGLSVKVACLLIQRSDTLIAQLSRQQHELAKQVESLHDICTAQQKRIEELEKFVKN